MGRKDATYTTVNVHRRIREIEYIKRDVRIINKF